MSQKILITGKYGSLASALVPYLPENQVLTTTSRVVEHDKKCIHLNLVSANEFDYGILDSKDIVIHMASISAPDICRNNPDLAWAVNVEGSSNFIGKCLERGAKVIFFSSDTVYAIENNNLLDEDSPCLPSEPYGRMKNEVESRFLGEKDFTTLRLSYVISDFDKFTVYLKKCVESNKQAEIIRAFKRSAISFRDLVDTVLAFINRRISIPIVNICGPEILSRMQIAEAFRASHAPGLRLQEIDAPDGFFESRPPEIAVVSKYLPDILGREPIKIADYYLQLAQGT